jgi:hypothetical protein
MTDVTFWDTHYRVITKQAKIITNTYNAPRATRPSTLRGSMFNALFKHWKASECLPDLKCSMPSATLLNAHLLAWTWRSSIAYSCSGNLSLKWFKKSCPHLSSTRSLTPQNRVFHEKTKVTQVKKFPVLNRTWKFITIFKTVISIINKKLIKEGI